MKRVSLTVSPVVPKKAKVEKDDILSIRFLKPYLNSVAQNLPYWVQTASY